MKDKFRLDINGLRAVAVIAVLLFHFEVPGFGGGFIGVDVFFVISGYLMTKIIADGIRGGSFSLPRFYLARCKRIVPALAAVCAAVIAFGYFYLAPVEYRRLGKHVAASLGFVSNITYWKEAGYFAPVSHEKWLLHTWSLSVEWQFYMLYPLVLLALHRLPRERQVRFAIGVIAFGSFVASVCSSVTSPEASFFLLHTRAWELLLGALVCFYPVRASRVLEILGLTLILASAMFVSADSVWPGWKALLPSSGAALVIMSNAGDRTVLRAAPVQWLGKISYSVYLWHWPLVVWLAQSDHLHALEWSIAGLVSALAIGSLSYVVIERNASQRSGVRLLPQYGQIVGIALPPVIAAFAVFAANGVEARMPASYGRIAAQLQMPTRANGWCFYSVDSLSNLKVGVDGLSCSIGLRQGAPRALLFGDSFAGQYEPFWDELARSNHVRVAAVSTNWCTPSLGDEFIGPNADQRSYRQCLVNRRFLRESMGKFEVVIFAGYWRALFLKEQQEGMFNAVRGAAKTAKLVVIMAAPTTFDVNVGARWERALLDHQMFDVRQLPKTRDTATTDANARLALFAAQFPNVVFLDRAELFNGSDVTADNVPFGLEGTHLSIFGSKAAARVFRQSASYHRVGAVFQQISAVPSGSEKSP
jgi:peptidoglycan/LPS O-acetylase OafA/YrhL